MDKSLSKKLEILGFIMTCFIIFYHTKALVVDYAASTADRFLSLFIYNYFDLMCTVAMSSFFTVTGFLLFRNLSFNNYPPKIKSRFFTLFIPFLLWQIVYLIISLISGTYNNDFLYKTFCFSRWPYCGQMWYVYTVFLLALLSPLLLFLFKRKRLAWVTIIFLTVLLTFLYYEDWGIITKIAYHGFIPDICKYLPPYLVGAFYGKFYPDLKEKDSLKFVVLLLFALLPLNNIFVGIFEATALKMLPLFILVTVPCTYKKDFKIGKISFLMYALHMAIIPPLVLLFEKLFLLLRNYVNFPLSLFNIFIYAFALSATIILSVLVRFLLKKFAPKVLSVLTGGRT